jgi:hypothetical protein
MRIPPSFDAAFRREHQIALAVKRLAGNRLRLLCDANRWLFAERLKTAESALSKMQLGLVRSLEVMSDLYAAVIVVPTRAEVSAATKLLEGEFPGAKTRVRARGDARTFVYDDVHVFAQLGKYAVGQASSIRNRIFEIQVHTGLQFAWWRATHDALYKGAVRNWRLERVASQVRGNLEMLDGVLADLEKGADLLLEARETDLDRDFDYVMNWLQRWPQDRRPEDRIRFYETVRDLVDAARLELAAAGSLLDGAYGRSLVDNEDVTPVQAVTAAVVEVRGLAPVLRRPHNRRWVLVTEELKVACPPLAKVPAARRARI